MRNPHNFEPRDAYPTLCSRCGRNRNDYQYHFVELGRTYHLCEHLGVHPQLYTNCCEPCNLRMCDACAVAHRHRPGVMRAHTTSEAEQYGHVFTYRSDYNQCSICNGTHGRDDCAEITRLRDEVKRLQAIVKSAHELVIPHLKQRLENCEMREKALRDL